MQHWPVGSSAPATRFMGNAAVTDPFGHVHVSSPNVLSAQSLPELQSQMLCWKKSPASHWSFTSRNCCGQSLIWLHGFPGCAQYRQPGASTVYSPHVQQSHVTVPMLTV